MIAATRTRRLVLRQLVLGDALAIAALLANWNVIRWLANPPWPYLPEHAQSFVAARIGEVEAPDHVFRAIAVEDAFAGLIAIECRAGEANLGYWLGERYWGHGYMTEAAAGMVGWYFSAATSDTLGSGYFVGNTASARIQARLGFSTIGRGSLRSIPLGKDVEQVETRLVRGDWLGHARG